jgi:hypothetical protein
MLDTPGGEATLFRDGEQLLVLPSEIQVNDCVCCTCEKHNPDGFTLDTVFTLVTVTHVEHRVFS